MREILNGKLQAKQRGIFEAAYRQSFEHVSAVVGAKAEPRLRAAGALALAVDERTILFSKRLDEFPEAARLAVVGHELAHAVQFARGGSDAQADLEAEAWRASLAALRGESFEIRGGARQETALAAVALVMDKNGEDYFKIFDTLAPLQVSKTEMITPLTYEKILDILLDKKHEKESDFVMQAHGTSLGFFIPIIDKQSNDKKATARNLRVLLQVATLLAAFKNAGDDFDKLKAVMKNIMKVQEPPTDAGTAKTTIQREIDRLKADCGVTKDDDVLRVVKKMADVQKKERGTIELRTCNMGGLEDTLNFFREQFNANTLGAPKLFSAFGRCRPDIGASAMKSFRKDHPENTVLYPSGTANFGFTYDNLDANFHVTTYSAAVSEAAVKSFVTSLIMGGKKFQTNDFPIHFLLLKSAVFPLDESYSPQIKHVTRPK
jgi:predicted SprT family Zn-dependent metalloprotease